MPRAASPGMPWTTPGKSRTAARRRRDDPVAFDSLDFVYHPSRDVKRDVAYFTAVLGGPLHFAVEGMGARGPPIQPGPQPTPVPACRPSRGRHADPRLPPAHPLQGPD